MKSDHQVITALGFLNCEDTVYLDDVLDVRTSTSCTCGHNLTQMHTHSCSHIHIIHHEIKIKKTLIYGTG